MRNRISRLPAFLFLMMAGIGSYAQDPPPNDANSNALTATATAASKMANTPINYYTGVPGISIPLYNYSHHNGLNLNVSLDYIGAGGIKVNEMATPSGIGWYLNAGGVVTRTVRGMPDDIPSKGFMYTGAIPADFRPNGYNYYHDSLDAEQDVFQFNFNGRSGTFFIGKNKQIVLVSLSKLRIGYTTTGGNNTPIASFYITTEDGTKYVFSDAETQSISNSDFKCGYNNVTYTTGWYLSQMIAPFGTDTIKFRYNTMNEGTTGIAFPQTAYVRNSDNFVYRRYGPTGTQSNTAKKIASISFPDKKNISFLYSRSMKYDAKDSAIDRIKIGDSIFRYGYLFTWGFPSFRTHLNSIIQYTATGSRPFYGFIYASYTFPSPGSPGDTLGNKRDHWGYFNSKLNGTNSIPTVPGVFNGADRNTDYYSVGASILQTIIEPSGGTTRYFFEPNNVNSYTAVPQSVSINVNGNTETAVSLSLGISTQYTFTFAFDNSFPRTGSPPFSGTCNLSCSITSTDGLTTYATGNVNLFQMFYAGSASFVFNVPNGNYKLKTSLSSCTVTPVSLSMPVNVSWQNQTLIGGAGYVGGVRIRQIFHNDPTIVNSKGDSISRTDTVATYQYLTTDGKSSGFLGAVPKYDYPYQETVINGSTTTTNYTAITSDPVNNLNYTQGSPVGYSRVIEYRGGLSHNLGCTVYEFTDLKDAGTNVTTPSFPYAPVIQPDWAMGLPKRVSTYDSLGHLVKVTTNTFTTTTSAYNSSDFQSLKLGKSSVTFNGDPNLAATPYTEYYLGQTYYPQGGRSDLTTTIDSLYHPDGSIQVNRIDLQYDTNYNVVKTISTYDKTRGLSLEKRIYYPYNYTLASGPIKKLKDSSIISPVISAESWITGDANPRIMGATITDFQQLPQGHIKPLTLYTLQSNAPVAQSVIGSFNAASLVRNTTYLKAQQSFPAYDAAGNLLETRNAVSGQSSSVIMDYFNQFPVAKVSNASSIDIAYTSFESDGSGNWTISGSARNNTAALTGKYSYSMASGNITKSGLNASTTYMLTVWCYTGASVTVNGTTLTGSIAQLGNWSLYQRSLAGITSITISGTGLIDELRVYPKDANMVTSTYEPMIGATSACNANNVINYYAYDNFNRLKVVRDENQNVLKKYEYDTITTTISIAPNWQSTGQTQCEGSGGRVDRQEKDNNLYSDTYSATRWVFDHVDCTACPPPCGPITQGYKVINCICETGTRVNRSSVHIKINNVWYWRCTYYYSFSDCSISPDYTEDNVDPCTINGACS